MNLSIWRRASPMSVNAMPLTCSALSVFMKLLARPAAPMRPRLSEKNDVHLLTAHQPFEHRRCGPSPARVRTAYRRTSASAWAFEDVQVYGSIFVPLNTLDRL